jgi:sec-independent protein translocase protein TatA
MFGFHAWDLLIVLLIALVIFGPRKLPEIGGALGKSIRDFKRTTSELTDVLQPTPTTRAPRARQLPTDTAVSASSSEAPQNTAETVSSEPG